MTEREIKEIKRRYRPEHSNISRVRGCYVNDKKESVAEFRHSLGMMTPEESEELLGILKKTFSGGVGRNIVDIDFTPEQVLHGKCQAHLATLRRTHLDDDDAIRWLYDTIKASFRCDGSYLIIVAYDAYDVPAYSKNGDDNGSSSMFDYILCSICPLKLTRAALSYKVCDNVFKNVIPDWVISAPEVGFMYPEFENRGANIYRAMYYMHDLGDNHSELTDAVFNAPIPMAVKAQRQTLTNIIEHAIGDECSIDVVKKLHEEIREKVDAKKADPNAYGDDPVTVTKEEIGIILETCGVADDRVDRFREEFDEQFGADTELRPDSAVDTRKFEVRTPEVVIKVKPECSELIRTRVIDGIKYITIRADADIEVNGTRITVQQKKAAESNG